MRRYRYRWAWAAGMALGLTACGGGGGSVSAGNGGIDRPQCQAAAALNPGNTSYGFAVPSVSASGTITLVNADNFNQTNMLKGSALSGSAVVAQAGAFTANASNPQLASTTLHPQDLVYVNGGDVYRQSLSDPPVPSPKALTSGSGITDLCTAKILTQSLLNGTLDDYLYAVPGSTGKCLHSANDSAAMVNVGTAAPATPTSVANANPVEALADPATGDLLAIVALDANNQLNAYKSDYTSPQLITATVPTGVVDLYHALNLAYVDDAGTLGGDTLYRLRATGDGIVSKSSLNVGGTITAATADAVDFYYAVGSDIYQMQLDSPLPSTNPSPVASGLTDVVRKLESGHSTSGTRLIALMSVTGSDSTGSLYAVNPTGSPQPVLLASSVVVNDPLFVSQGNVYYTVQSGTNFDAHVVGFDGNGAQHYPKSTWFAATYPQQRTVNTEPDHILLAAGYTGRPSTFSGAVLDSFPTAPNSTCITFNEGVNALPVVSNRYGPIGSGSVTAGSTAQHFVLDASDGRFKTLP